MTAPASLLRGVSPAAAEVQRCGSSAHIPDRTGATRLLRLASHHFVKQVGVIDADSFAGRA
jgi:hypothetical protein